MRLVHALHDGSRTPARLALERDESGGLRAPTATFGYGKACDVGAAITARRAGDSRPSDESGGNVWTVSPGRMRIGKTVAGTPEASLDRKRRWRFDISE
ncbi:hypothetical protein HPB50_019379 [Hyalomma asiaticum]|uniref:Uncharacterized protein n=1 Tax=Hyalomma asiaticum TaxID=266040 RepID=A0ACB7SH92_HYAAI|nr:hypothetical protein HPB50_019379 [Hyalomma asiaticum]